MKEDLRATPDMKTEVAPTTTTHPSTTVTATTTARIVSTGAVVRIPQTRLRPALQSDRSLQVPEETNQYDDIENRTKIMMRFMDDLTNIYFSTRNSLRLTVENGLFRIELMLSPTFLFIAYLQDGSCNGDSGTGYISR